jgi:hypothetical protein
LEQIPDFYYEPGPSYSYTIVSSLNPAANSYHQIYRDQGPAWVTVANSTLNMDTSGLVKGSYTARIYFDALHDAPAPDRILFTIHINYFPKFTQPSDTVTVLAG